MASTGRSSQGSGSRAGSGGARGASGGSDGRARGAQRGNRGASAREVSSDANPTSSGGPGSTNIGRSAGIGGGRGGAAGSAGISGSTGSSSAGTGGAGAARPQSRGGGMTGQSGTSRMDSERQVQINREAPQQGRTVGRGESGVQGGAQGGAQAFGTPFAFMRRFGEEMDRLFSDFGFGPPGYDSELGLLGWPASGGRPSLALGANMPRGTAGRGQSLGRGEVAGSGSAAERRPSPSNAYASRSAWAPQVEVLQRGNNLVLRADLPGLRREDVHLEVDDGMLTISGERRYESESEGEGLYHSERSYGRFSRSIPLPPGTDGDSIEARFSDGVLEVTLPLPQERSRARRIEIR